MLVREEDLDVVGVGVVVIVGLVLFMEGLQVGLMPFSETLGRKLPAKSPLPVVLAITCTLGVGVTFAEPAIGALQAAGALVDVRQSPYLYALLTTYSLPLVLLVGLAVGIAAVIGALGLDNLIGQDYRMRKVFDLVESVADSNVTVLIQGSSGTGKSLTDDRTHRTAHELEFERAGYNRAGRVTGE